MRATALPHFDSESYASYIGQKQSRCLALRIQRQAQSLPICPTDDVDDASLRRRQWKLIHPNQRLPPGLTEDGAPRTCENRG